MRVRLGWKLGFTYLLLIVLSMAGFGYFTMDFLENSYLQQKQAALFTHANITANASAPFLRDPDKGAYLYSVVREAGERVGNRFLILDETGRVVADSANDVVGKVFRHQEIKLALEGENAATPYYEKEFGWVLYLAVPVYSGKQVIGAVFLSADINSLVAELDSIRTRLFYFSLLSGILVFIVSLLLGNLLTKPIRNLMGVARKIAAGHYGTLVEGVSRRDELGELTEVFNDMSLKISKEDNLRKQFIANASHELKSPVAALKALLQALPEEPLAEKEQKELFGDLKFEVDRLGKLVEDLLVLGRLEGNQQDLKLEETSVGELVEAVKRAVNPVAQQKHVTVRTIHGGNLYWLMDGEKIFRALLNLADNAVKYSPTGGTVSIEFRMEGEKLLLSVEDTGEGIPAAEIPHIFERFYRVDKARSRKTGGWGLGLAIVKEITEMHRGTVQVESEPGKKTVFTIILPAQDDKLNKLKT